MGGDSKQLAAFAPAKSGKRSLKDCAVQIDNTPAMPQLIDIHGVMRVTKLGRTTIYRYIQSGELKPLKMGKRTMFTEAQIAAWIKGKMGQAA